jgi:hypothetical protein
MHSARYKPSKYVRISACICLSAIVVLSLIGASQDIQELLKNIRRYGTECTLRARILDKTDDKNGLLVQKAPATTVTEKRIYVFVTKQTKIGYWVHGASPTWKALSYDDLKVEEHVLIHGLKIIEKEDGQELLYVEAKRIEPSE